MTCYARRDIFLQIEPLHDYSPVAPVVGSRRYGHDCQFTEGHELGRISAEEILERRVQALAYRECRDPYYTTPVAACFPRQWAWPSRPMGSSWLWICGGIGYFASTRWMAPTT